MKQYWKGIVYLVIAAVITTVIVFLPLTQVPPFVEGEINNPYELPLHIIMAIIAFVAVIAILFYKNNKIQVILCYIGFSLALLVMVGVLTIDFFVPNIRLDSGSILAVPCWAIFLAAAREIRKDEGAANV